MNKRKINRDAQILTQARQTMSAATDDIGAAIWAEHHLTPHEGNDVIYGDLKAMYEAIVRKVTGYGAG